MSGGKQKVPLVIRLIIGKGWGQGPQHSQSLETLFAHIPGLKVVAPSNAYDAKGLLVSSIRDNGPVIFFEHRWLHNILGRVPKKIYSVKIGKAKVIQKGKDITIISFSDALFFNCFERTLGVAVKKSLLLDLILFSSRTHP